MQEQLDINSIMKDFKLFVESQLLSDNIKKQQQKPTVTSKKQIDAYYESLQKRLKIKPIPQGQKFQNILAPMKKLKSFVSVRQFLRGLHEKKLSQQYSKPQLNKNTSKKLQYEQLRGGLYMQKVQNHLKKYNLKRKLDDQAQTLLKDLEQIPAQKNQYRNWMQNVLGNISMKQEIFITEEQKHYQFENLVKLHHKKINSKNQALIIQDLQQNEQKIKLKKQNQKNKQNDNYKFVTNYLTERLKKILTDKFVNNASKQKRKNRTLIKPPLIKSQKSQNNDQLRQSSMGNTTRRLMCRTTNTNKRLRTTQNSYININHRAKTSDINNRKPFQDIWKNKVNSKMNDLLFEVNNQFKKSIQNKKQIKLLYNKINNENHQNIYM